MVRVLPFTAIEEDQISETVQKALVKYDEGIAASAGMPVVGNLLIEARPIFKAHTEITERFKMAGLEPFGNA